MRFFAALILACATFAGSVVADQRTITLAATTSTGDVGLFTHLLPLFRADTGIDVRVIVAGTGQAIRYAERGDADVLIVHHRASEEKFLSDGYGLQRFDLMYNDFIIVGPQADPAAVGGLGNAVQALAAIAQEKAPFASRGDDSGTHKRELTLWRGAGVDPAEAHADWYRETGSGQGITLNIASSMGAYCLTDRATWLSFGNRNGLQLLVEGDRRLLNQYGLMVVNPAQHSHTSKDAAQSFADWMLSEKGQAAINAFRVGGEQAFYANAQPRR